MNTYFYEGIAFIPSYMDTDFFQTEIQAKNEQDAEIQLHNKYQFIKGFELVNVESHEE